MFVFWFVFVFIVIFSPLKTSFTFFSLCVLYIYTCVDCQPHLSLCLSHIWTHCYLSRNNNDCLCGDTNVSSKMLLYSIPKLSHNWLASNSVVVVLWKEAQVRKITHTWITKWNILWVHHTHRLTCTETLTQTYTHTHTHTHTHTWKSHTHPNNQIKIFMSASHTHTHLHQNTYINKLTHTWKIMHT